jgi:hypothetical protein
MALRQADNSAEYTMSDKRFISDDAITALVCNADGLLSLEQGLTDR